MKFYEINCSLLKKKKTTQRIIYVYCGGEKFSQCNIRVLICFKKERNSELISSQHSRKLLTI